MAPSGFLIVVLLSAAFAGLFLIWFLRSILPLHLLFKANRAGLTVSVTDLIAMRLRGTSPRPILSAAVTLAEAGIPISLNQLEAQVLAGGNIQNVALALLAAKRAGRALDFRTASAIDLAGQNPFEVMKRCLEPTTVTTERITGRTQNGCDLHLVARLTMRGSLERTIGGSSQSALVTAVSDHLRRSLTAAPDERTITRNLEALGREILKAGHDRTSAWELLAAEVTTA